MKIVLFCHSLVSDWNHGNAHFLRGICSELIERGHALDVYEERGNWSLENLLRDHGEAPLAEFRRIYPGLSSHAYDPDTLNIDQALAGADIVLVHEWTRHALVRRIGEYREGADFTLLLHDSHHRAISDRDNMLRRDLSGYDGVLAFGEVIRRIYLEEGWAKKAWTWHEAADTRVFRPLDGDREGDLVWIGNWGDDERTEELQEYLIEPVRNLGLRAAIYGVRYPESAQALLRDAGIEYRGWLPNYRAPEIFSRYRVTVHVPRRPYVTALPGIPTIRMFEALACGIPLVSVLWEDTENLFRLGEDYLGVRTGAEMEEKLEAVLSAPGLGAELAFNGLETIRTRHTCGHRVDQLLDIHNHLRAKRQPQRGGYQRVPA